MNRFPPEMDRALHRIVRDLFCDDQFQRDLDRTERNHFFDKAVQNKSQYATVFWSLFEQYGLIGHYREQGNNLQLEVITRFTAGYAQILLDAKQIPKTEDCRFASYLAWKSMYLEHAMERVSRKRLPFQGDA